MFIGNLPTIVSQWVALCSLASSLRNDAISRNTQVNKPYGTKEGCEVFKVFA